MRIGIREQLGAVLLLTALVPLAVLSIAVWINNRNFVVNITNQELALTASLKASQIASDLLLIQSTCATITTRILLNQALKSYYRGNSSAMNWTAAVADVTSALDSTLRPFLLGSALLVHKFPQVTRFQGDLRRHTSS